jgi:hypothetical protein
MNKNYDGLKKVYLIKSADYQFAEIDLTQNTLLLGDSGVGKTTLMRAVLFFYTMDYSNTMLNINSETKKPFIEWYFKYSNSHIVYEYTKDDSTFWFIMSSKGRPLYTFVDISHQNINIKDIFIEEDTPVEAEKLHENLQAHKLSYYETSRKDKFIQTFHKKDIDNKKIKQESETNFTLFEDIASRKEFAKTLSNIFATSKVNSDSLKKTIVSLITDSEASINLNKIKNHLSEYISEKKEIELFEQKIPTIEKLSIVLTNYFESKKVFKQKANEVHALKIQSQLKITQTQSQIEQLKHENSENEMSYKVASQIIQTSMSADQEYITIETYKIKELQEAQKKFQAKNIDALLVEHEKKEQYKNRQKKLNQRYSALTSNADDINQKYSKLLNTLEKERDNDLLHIKNKKNDEIERLNNKKQTLLKQHEDEIGTKTSTLKAEKEGLKTSLLDVDKALNSIKILQAKNENFPYNQENIVIYTKEVQGFEKALLELKPQKIEVQNKIEKVDKAIYDISTALKIEKDKLLSKTELEKEKLFAEKTSIEKKLDFDSDNLYGFINKNEIKNRDKILTVLSEDILFSDVPFTATQINNSETLYGLSINFHEHLSNNYDSRKLQERLESLKHELKECNKKERQNHLKLEHEAAENTKNKNRERTHLYYDKNELAEKEKSYLQSLSRSELNLAEARNNAKSKKEQESERLNILYVQQYNEQQRLTDKENLLSQQIKTITVLIESTYKKQNNAVLNALDIVQKNYDVEVQNIYQRYEEDVKKTNNECSLALSSKGVDPKILNEIISEIKTLKENLESIEKSSTDVNTYLELYHDEIKNIPARQKLLHTKKELLTARQKELNELTAKQNTNHSKITQEIQNCNFLLNTVKNFLNDYQKRLLDQDIGTSLSMVLSSDFENTSVNALINNPNYINSVIENLLIQEAKVQGNIKDIKLETQRCLKGVHSNNAFHLPVIDDYIQDSENLTEYIRVAQEWVEYIQKDKLLRVKELTLDKFQNSLNIIIKELSLFEEAILDIKAQVGNLKNIVKRAVDSFNVIDSIAIASEDTNNEILTALKTISSYYTQHSEKFLEGLFNSKEDTVKNDKELTKYREALAHQIDDLITLLIPAKEYLKLENGFVLEFKVIEKGNDLGWRQSLNDIGSNGTSTLVKSIINISMLQMVSKNIMHNRSMQSHAILDEIGTISTDYFKELKDFVNNSGFIFVNGMPTEDDILISMYPTVYVGEDCGSYSRMHLASKVIV